MKELDRAGIFKAKPVRWHVRKSGQSEAVALSVQFQILAQLGDGSTWVDWTEYEDHAVHGDFWIILKNGEISDRQMSDLVVSLGWDGDILSVEGRPPDVVVQITVKEEQRDGRTSFLAKWINPGDFTPQPSEASPEDLKALNARFGSLLRAAAAGSKPAARPAPKQGTAPKPAAPPANTPAKPLDPQRVEKEEWDTLGGP